MVEIREVMLLIQCVIMDASVAYQIINQLASDFATVCTFHCSF